MSENTKNFIVEQLLADPELLAAVISELSARVSELAKPAPVNEFVQPAPAVERAPKHTAKHAAKPKKAEKAERGNEWWNEFVSPHTTVKVKSNIVHVSVARGHASEWKQALRNAGFRWSSKNRCYWAYQDASKRAEIAARNQANDAATAGMTPEEKKAYWAERRAARNVA